MTPSLHRARHWLRQHWFFLAAAALVSADLILLRVDDWSSPRLLEAGLLFDFAVIVPLLYLWCYRSNGKAALLRAIGLSCLAIWACGRVIPSEHQHVLSAINWLRYVGLAFLTLIEIKLMIKLYRAVFLADSDSATTSEKLGTELGLPPWLTRLAMLEVQLWCRLGNFLKRLTGFAEKKPNDNP